MARSYVVVDGSNIATEGRSTPSLAQLDEAVRQFQEEFPDNEVIVVVDASFGRRIDEAERPAFEEAVAHGELVSPPAGAVGRGDAFLLRVAERVSGQVLSNDSFQEFHAEHPWLFEEGRLIGGKPVPGVGWFFTPRTPVRGALSRSVRATPGASAGKKTPGARTVKAARTAAEKATKADAAHAIKATKAPRATTKATAAEPVTATSARTAKAAALKTDKTAKTAATAKKAQKVHEATKADTAKRAEPDKQAKKAKKAEPGKKAVKAKKAAKAKKAEPTKKAKGDGETRAPTAEESDATAVPPDQPGTGRRRRRRRRGGAVEEPAVRAAIDAATDEAIAPSTDRTSPGASGGRRRQDASPPAAVNDPLTFLTFVTEHPVGSSVDGEVSGFVSHGATVDVDGMQCYLPLAGLASPPPRRAREVLERGERRTFVVVALDPPRRGAELALPELAAARMQR